MGAENDEMGRIFMLCMKHRNDGKARITAYSNNKNGLPNNAFNDRILIIYKAGDIHIKYLPCRNTK
jgi:hypothetical protein